MKRIVFPLPMLFCYVFLFLSVFCICCSSSVDENSLSAKDTLSLSEVIIKPSINDSDFRKYRTFNELKMKGEGLLNEQDDSFFVLVKETADSIMVIRSDNPRHTIVYKRKAWGWFDKEVVQYGDDEYYDVYSRYILDNRVLEFCCSKTNDHRVLCKFLFVSTNDKCISYRLDNKYEWNEDSIPDLKAVIRGHGFEYRLQKGRWYSYYIAAYDTNDKECYIYAKEDTTTFLRSPGLRSRSIRSETYGFRDDAYINAGEMPIVNEDEVSKYILAHSGPKLRNYAENNKIIVLLKVSELGRISEVILLRPKDDDLKKQLCRSVPIQCVPGTIAETPVPVRYVMIIQPKNRE